MENPIFRAYQKFDDEMMYLANKAVRAYNRTTGGTNAKLANRILSGAAIFESVGFINRKAYSMAPLLIGLSHFSQTVNSNEEKLEESAQKINCIYKNSSREFLGPIWLGISTLHAGIGASTLSPYFSESFIATGHALRGLSYYIMRADYKKPRKTNAWQRAKRKYGRKMRDTIKGLSPSPQPSPAHYTSLEETLI